MRGWSRACATPSSRRGAGTATPPACSAWLGLSLLIAVGLLFAVYAIAKLSNPDLSTFIIPGYNTRATLGDYLAVLYHRGLVLALHAMACVAGLAGGSLPLVAEQHSGLALGAREGRAARDRLRGVRHSSRSARRPTSSAAPPSIAAQLGTSPGRLLLALAPHALPELVALFLPLAAWLVASRREQWHELLAATRHDRHRRAGPARRGGRRAVALAGAARDARALSCRPPRPRTRRAAEGRPVRNSAIRPGTSSRASTCAVELTVLVHERDLHDALVLLAQPIAE